MKKILVYLPIFLCFLILMVACASATPSPLPATAPLQASTPKATQVPTATPTFPPASSTPEATDPPSATPTQAATSAPPLSILPHDTIDPSTLTGKLMMGYQGWFSCPGDGTNMYNGYYHWIHDGFPKLNAENFRVDMFPDTRELTEDEKCPTALKLPDGSPAYVYTSANDKTVLRHFQWMSEYGIDGVFLQRFGVQLAYPEWRDFHTDLLVKVRDASETYGRAWAVMYDVTGANEKGNSVVTLLERDWKYLVDSQKILESPQYLHHNGLPVVAIWGLGFDDRPGTAAEAMQLLDFFQNNPDPKYRAIVLGGVPIFWRTLQSPARKESAWKDFYCALDIISPWTVGVAASDAEVDNYYRNTVRADMTRATECGAEYMPVVYPGTAYHNPADRPFNEQPRRGGRLYWRQVYDALSLGATMLYNAMFDEVDEATAMYKIAETTADVPAGIQAITMDTDGESLPSDWYLRLAGEATKMLRGEIPLTSTIPITPSEPSNPEALQKPERIQLKITTSSDWTTVALGGIQFTNAQIIFASAEAPQTSADLNESLLVLTQTLARANAGKSVEMIVDLFPAELGGSSLTITIGRGSIGKTVVEVYVVVGATTTLIQTIEWADVVSGENSATFEVPASLLEVTP